MPLFPGTRIGPYEVVTLAGTGGMGEVYRARDTRLDRDVAIKVLPISLAADADRLRRFEQEARAVAALNHPNILSVFDVGSYQGAPYLVCEFLEGESLRERIRAGALSQRKAMELALQVAHGLAAAHEKSVLHRDLKPENLFVLRDGRLKILDFGLAKLHRPERLAAVADAATLASPQTSAGLVLGTAGYMAPEQVRGQDTDHRSDVFSFGAVLYEMFSGRRAFQRDSALETMAAILQEEPADLATVAPGLPPALQRIVQRCLEKEPEQRFQSASDLAFALEALTTDGESTARPVAQLPTPPAPEPATPPPAGLRLESWKEIASYLKRDVRTVKRWEKEEGLPVHRHVHKKLASVYAYGSELDEWQRSRKPREEPRGPELPRRLSLDWRWVAMALVIMVVAAGYVALRPGEVEETWVLIGRFENRTGEDVFDGTLEYALERELSNSPSIKVAPRERVADALLLMRKPANTVMDREVGREVCLRDGGIRALLTGRVEKLDDTYILSADVVDPASGVVVAGLTEEARSQKEMLAAAHRLSGKVREALGERTASIRARAKLEKATTPSLRALHLYSQATALTLDHEWNHAAGLLRQALAEDPDFASAHQLLAHCLENTGRLEEAKAHFERAFRLSGTTAERERLFIRSGYYGRFQKDKDKAIEALETLARLYPDHYFAVGNLRFYYRSLGKPREALRYSVRRAELRPTNFTHQLQAAHELLVWGDAAQAQAYYKRAQDLLAAGSNGSPQLHAWYKGWLATYPFSEKWLRGDLPAAQGEADRLAQRVPEQPADEFALKWQAACAQAALGKYAAARQVLASITNGPGEYLALAALSMGDEEGARAHLRRAGPSHRAAILQIRTGMLDQAEKALANPTMLDRPRAPFLPHVWTKLVEGELALAGGNSGQAIPLLREAVDGLALDATPFFFLGSQALARAFEQQGDLEKSIEVLEAAYIYRREAVFWGPALLFWMNNEVMRARLYRQRGREADASQIESELAQLLAHADPEQRRRRELQFKNSGR